MSRKTFVDTNILLYLLSEDSHKADKAEAILRNRPVISVQVLNEFTNAALKKLGLTWQDIDEFIAVFQALCEIKPLTLFAHNQGRQLAWRYSFSVYDAMIVSSALEADCAKLYSEDMQDGLKVENKLTIVNPL